MKPIEEMSIEEIYNELPMEINGYCIKITPSKDFDNNKLTFYVSYEKIDESGWNWIKIENSPSLIEVSRYILEWYRENKENF